MKFRQVFKNHSFFIILSGIIILLFLSLGTWQLFRYEKKIKYVKIVETQMSHSPEQFENLLAEGLPFEHYKFRKVILTGHLDKSRVNYLQAQVRNGKLGVNIILPLKLSSGTFILLNLGWVKENDINGLIITDQLITIEGYLKTSDRPNRFTPKNDYNNNKLYFIDIIQTAKHYHIPTLLPLYLIVTHSNPVLENVHNNSASIQFQNVHLSYALTWYAMGIIWTVLVWLYQRRKYLKRQNIPLLNELTPDKKIVSK